MKMVDENNKYEFEPFSVDKIEGEILSHATENITLKFCPKEVYECKKKLLIYIKGLENVEPIKIIVEGSSERPVCHFELDNSKLVEKLKEKHIEFPPRSILVDIFSIGTKVKNSKKFYVLNPTSDEYEFEWE